MRGVGARLLPAALLSLLIVACSLAGDVTPPPALATAQMARPLPTAPASAEVTPPDSLPDLIDPSARASVTGTVRTGTAAAVVPAGLQINLFGIDGQQEAIRQTVAADAQGGFLFEGLEAVPGRLFFTTVEYQGVLFRSELAHAPADLSPLELPLMIYETSPDPGELAVERLHVLIDFPAKDLIRVLELWVLANPSDRVITSPLDIRLPSGAVNLTFEQGALGQRFELTDQGFLDREPIPPGSGIDQLAFGFDLPRSTLFEQPVQQPVLAVTVLVPADGPRVSGLQDQGVQDLGGLSMRNYVGGALRVGEALRFRVIGSVGRPPAIAGTIVGGGALLGAGLLAARWWTARNSPQSAGPQGAEQLLQAMAGLDDEFERGEIVESSYHKRRAELKARALAAMRRADD